MWTLSGSPGSFRFRYIASVTWGANGAAVVRRARIAKYIVSYAAVFSGDSPSSHILSRTSWTYHRERSSRTNWTMARDARWRLQVERPDVTSSARLFALETIHLSSGRRAWRFSFTNEPSQALPRDEGENPSRIM